MPQVAVIGQNQRGHKENSGQYSRAAREKSGTAAGTKQAARSAPAKRGARIGAFALLHQNEHDDAYRGNDLCDQQNVKNDIHGG